MKSPAEPLLPPEAPPPPRLKLRLLAGGAGILVLGGVVAGLLLSGRRSDEPLPSTPERAAAGGADASGAPKGRAKEIETGEPAARASYAAAEAFEREHPQDLERIAARYREVYAKHPSSAAGRKAEEKFRAASDALQKALDRDLEGVRRQARALAGEGRYVEAIDVLKTFREAQSRDALRRRADEEVASLENESRDAWNQTAARARSLAAQGDFAGAGAALEAVQKGAIAEVAERCRAALKELRAAAADSAEAAEVMKGEAAHQAVRADVAPKLLVHLRARRYDEALKEIDAALAAPAYAAVKNALADERAAIAEAASFWEAFVKSLRTRLNLEVTLPLAEGKPVTGKLTRIHPDRLTVESGETQAEVAIEKLSVDVIVGWTIGRTLPAEEGATYVKAALFFFCDGREDLARLYLATAHEMKAPADAPERIFREGFLRAAVAAKAAPPPPPKGKKGK